MKSKIAFVSVLILAASGNARGATPSPPSAPSMALTPMDPPNIPVSCYPATPGIPYLNDYVPVPYVQYVFPPPGSLGTYWDIDPSGGAFAGDYFNDQCIAIVSDDPILECYPNAAFICQIDTYTGPNFIGATNYAYTSVNNFFTLAAPTWFTGAPTLWYAGLIFSNNGLSISNGWGELLVDNGSPVNGNTTYCPYCGDPVNLSNGTLWEKAVDFKLAGRTSATDLILQRNYHSQPVFLGGDFGPNWTSNWDTRIMQVNSSLTNLAWVDRSGNVWVFSKNQDGTYQSPAGFFGKLSELSDHYEIRDPQGIVMRYSKIPDIAPLGRLVSISEPHGESIQVAYDSNGRVSSVQSALAGGIRFSRNAQGQVVSVTRERDSLTYQYSYDADGDLISFTDFAGNTTSYAYTSLSSPRGPVGGLLTSVTDPIGRVQSFQYDLQARVIQNIEHGGGKVELTYDAPSAQGPVTEVTDLDAQKSIYHFDSDFRLTSVIQPDGSVRSQEWNSQNELVFSVDELGYKTSYGYDGQGNLNSIQRPMDPSPVLIDHDPEFSSITRITPLSGAPVINQVNPINGDIVASSRSSLALAIGYDSLGHAISFNNGRASYSNETDANGLLTFVFDARNPETRSYDSRGRVISRSFKSGRILKYAYDNFDQVIRIDDSNGPSIVLTYDTVHRITSKTMTDGTTNESTRYQWDARDRLVSRTDALGNVTAFQYDRFNPDGSLAAVLDLPVARIDANGHKTAYSYDLRDRLSETRDPRGGVTTYQYDARGELSGITDPLGRKTSFVDDGNHRLISQVRPSLKTDAQGVTQAVQETTQYFYDLSGKLIKKSQRVFPKGSVAGVTEYSYDSLDRLIEKREELVDSSGQMTLQDDSTYSYQPELDTLKLATAHNAVESLSFTYDTLPPFKSLGYSVQAADSSNPLGLTTGQFEITRDVTNRISRVGSPSGRALWSANYDPAGRLVSISSQDPFGDSDTGFFERLMDFRHESHARLQTRLTYDSFGRRAAVAHSTGLSGSFAYDLMNRPTSIVWSKTSDGFFAKPEAFTFENLDYDPAGNIIGEERPFGLAQLGYDPRNELTSVSLPAAHHADDFARIYDRALSYDLNGNRTLDSRFGAASFTNDQIVSQGGVNFSSDPDGFGDLTGEVGRDAASTLAYRIDGKLISYSREPKDRHRDRDEDTMEKALLTVSYDYDALGRRVAKEISRPQGEKRVFAYSYLSDQDRILIGKSPDGGQTLYLDGEGIDQHLGEVSARRALGYATDHLGSVLNSQVAGPDHAYGPYGEALGDNDRAARLDSEPVIYGFTGRQFDPESRLYDYRARMYDPDTGRFLTKDPIGTPGTNGYEYAQNDSLIFVDPSGQCPLVAANPIVGSTIVVGVLTAVVFEASFDVTTFVLALSNGQSLDGAVQTVWQSSPAANIYGDVFPSPAGEALEVVTNPDLANTIIQMNIYQQQLNNAGVDNQVSPQFVNPSDSSSGSTFGGWGDQMSCVGAGCGGGSSPIGDGSADGTGEGP